MQMVSGPVGRERVHFKAPGAERLEDQMRRFPESFNTGASAEPLLKAALAHLWFETIHLFDDGNGRIARVLADMSLARSEGSSQPFYTMSAQIREQRSEYYGILEPNTDGDDGRHAPDGLVPGLHHARNRGCTGRALTRDRVGAVPGEAARCAAE
jgi:Fic family protein